MLHPSLRRLYLQMRCNQLFKSWNPTNKPTNLLMYMSVPKETQKLTEDQPTNQEIPFNPRSKKKGLSLSHGPRTRTRTETTKPRSPLTRARGEEKTFKKTLTPNPIIETEDIDNQTPDRGIPELPYSSQNQVSPLGGILGKFWKVWQDLGADLWVVSTIQEGYNLEFHRKPSLTLQPKFNLNSKQS